MKTNSLEIPDNLKFAIAAAMGIPIESESKPSKDGKSFEITFRTAVLCEVIFENGKFIVFSDSSNFLHS